NYDDSDNDDGNSADNNEASLGEDRYEEGDVNENEEDTYYEDEMIEYDNLDKELVKEIRRLMFWVKGLKVNVDARGSLLGAEEK
ncbi:1941_t:CDS:2, partial [Cetraspora pellucida]